MARNSNLHIIRETSNLEPEKRVFPRFPMSYIAFKSVESENSGIPKTYEVRDISFTGMQLEQKLGNLELSRDQLVKGIIAWNGRKCEIQGHIRWIDGPRAGVQFVETLGIESKIRQFFSVENIIRNIKPLHSDRYEMDRPAGLRYWLRSDGPFELFIWENNSSATSGANIQKIQILCMRDFVEWDANDGLRTGRIVHKKYLDTPLTHQDELTVDPDYDADMNKIQLAAQTISQLREEWLDKETLNLVRLKIQVSQ